MRKQFPQVLVSDDDLIFESIEPDNDSTPVTLHAPWQRGLPPPLPGTDS